VRQRSWQQDAIEGRLTFRAANPVTQREAGATGQPYPFAVLDSGGTLLAAQTSAKSGRACTASQ